MVSYDVKKYFKNDTRRMSTNKILRKKKGLWTAYSQVFSELCFHAGLKTAEVEGYTKSLFTDADDKFYYADHVWNSIELDGKWELVDMTWCSGSIKFTGQSAWQKFLKIWQWLFSEFRYKYKKLWNSLKDYDKRSKIMAFDIILWQCGHPASLL